MEDMKRDLARQQEVQLERLRRELSGVCMQSDFEVGAGTGVADVERLRHDLDTSQSVQATQGAYFRVDLEQQKAKATAVEAMLLELRGELTDLQRERTQQAAQTRVQQAMLGDLRSELDSVREDVKAQEKAGKDIKILHDAMMQGASGITQVMKEVSTTLSSSEEKMRHEVEEARRGLEAAASDRCKMILEAFDKSIIRLATSVTEERDERRRESSVMKATVRTLVDSCTKVLDLSEAEPRRPLETDAGDAAGAAKQEGRKTNSQLQSVTLRLDSLEQGLAKVAKHSEVQSLEVTLNDAQQRLESLGQRVEQVQGRGGPIRSSESTCSFTGSLVPSPTCQVFAAPGAMTSPRMESRGSSARPVQSVQLSQQQTCRSLEPPPRRATLGTTPASEDHLHSALLSLVQKMDEVLVKPPTMQISRSPSPSFKRDLHAEAAARSTVAASSSAAVSRSSSKDHTICQDMQLQQSPGMFSPHDRRRSPALSHRANSQFQVRQPASASRTRVFSPHTAHPQPSRQASGNLTVRHHSAVVFAPTHGMAAVPGIASAGGGQPLGKVVDPLGMSLQRQR